MLNFVVGESPQLSGARDRLNEVQNALVIIDDRDKNAFSSVHRFAEQHMLGIGKNYCPLGKVDTAL